LRKLNLAPEMLELIKNIAGEDISKQDFYRGKGCKECGNSGYKGRIGIFEVLEIDKELREFIGKEVSIEQIQSIAKKKGMNSLFMDGLDKVSSGMTTIEEVLRVVRE